MLWYKSWLETRWRFAIGAILLALSAAGGVIAYREVLKLLPLVPNVDVSGELGRRVKEAAELARDYRGYVWSQWYRGNMPQMWTIFAVLLGTGGLLSPPGSGGLFTLSLPVSRDRLVAARAALGGAELLALALVPVVVLPLISPAIGQRYSVIDASIHAVCMFIAGGVFYSFAVLLSTVFNDIWRPLLIALSVAIVLALCEEVLRDAWPVGLFRVMSAEAYFRTGQLPWLGLVSSAAVSAVMLFAAARNFARQDF